MDCPEMPAVIDAAEERLRAGRGAFGLMRPIPNLSLLALLALDEPGCETRRAMGASREITRGAVTNSANCFMTPSDPVKGAPPRSRVGPQRQDPRGPRACLGQGHDGGCHVAPRGRRRRALSTRRPRSTLSSTPHSPQMNPLPCSPCFPPSSPLPSSQGSPARVPKQAREVQGALALAATQPGGRTTTTQKQNKGNSSELPVAGI